MNTEEKELRYDKLRKGMEQLWQDAREAGFNNLAPYKEWKESQKEII